jgi:GTP-binding protein EngB required for normal cell division
MPSTSPDNVSLIDHFSLLVKESEVYFSKQKNREDVVGVMRETLGHLLHFRKRLKSAVDNPVVSFVGLTNVGKSTLLNALLGGDVAPRRNGPCTAVPIEFKHGKRVTITPIYTQRLRKTRFEANSVDELHDTLARLAAEDGESTGRPKKVIVELPARLLESGLIIADTPGFGAAMADSDNPTHDSVLEDYLRYEATQVFWIVMADQGIGKFEKEVYNDLLAEVCDDIIVTGAEDWDENDRLRFRKRFGGLLAGGTGARAKVPLFHFVSGLKGLQAREEKDRVALEKAGIVDLAQRIRGLAKVVGRTNSIEQRLIQLAQDLRDWLAEFRDVCDFALKDWFRPDSFERFRSAPFSTSVHREIVRLLSRDAA